MVDMLQPGLPQPVEVLSVGSTHARVTVGLRGAVGMK